MARRKTTVEYWVPDWAWCEMPNPDGKTKTGERCRFCQEIKKRGNAPTFRCLMHNKDLLVESGSVKKCGACLLWKENTSVQEPPELAKVSQTTPAKCVKHALKTIDTEFFRFRKEGIPEQVAMKLAVEEVTKQWS